MTRCAGGPSGGRVMDGGCGARSVVRVVKCREEAPGIVTLRFRLPAKAVPGQFIMAWLPGVDEVPMSLSHFGTVKGITFMVRGDATRALAALKAGDRFGVRGPAGRGFALKGRRMLMVGGGTGMSPIAGLAELSLKKRRTPVVVTGARSADRLLFVERLRKAGIRVEVSTDDGSAGFHGTAVGLMKKLLKDERFDSICTCGPEAMMYAVVVEARRRRIPVQASLERYMKCGVGMCDACAVAGRHVCTDGPVFSGEELAGMPEFGRWHRDASGARRAL